MMRSLRIASLLPLLAAAGCAEVTGPGGDPLGFDPVVLDARITQSYTAFGLELFDALAAKAPDENLFVSPTSAAFALAMTYNGAAGETAEQMARVLGLSEVPLQQVNAANRDWLAALRETGDSSVELALANSIWSRQGYPFYESFYDRNREYYGAEVRELPFDDAAIRVINDWVDESTRGKIDRIIDEIVADDVMFLINALYFKGTWQYRFAKEETRPASFRRVDGSDVQVPMMKQRAELPYLRADGFQMVALPYGKGRFSMVLALPDNGTTLADFYRRLTPDLWERSTEAMEKLEVGVILPRFRMESDLMLNEPLSEMGMELAFTPYAADFSEMSPRGRDLFIAFVRQKTFVEVNEIGTEAAAVTAVGIQPACAGCGPEYPILNFNRPFFFAIQDNATGTLLFLGQMMDPAAG